MGEFREGVENIKEEEILREIKNYKDYIMNSELAGEFTDEELKELAIINIREDMGIALSEEEIIKLKQFRNKLGIKEKEL